MSLIASALQFLYPPYCRSCQKLVPAHDVLCSTCINTLKPVVSLHLPIAKTQTLRIFSVGAYSGALHDLVVKKFSQDTLASKQLGQLIVRFTPVSTMLYDYAVPIPLHWTRYAQRGFNQACEIGAVVAHNLDIPLLPLLRRKKRTLFQSQLGQKQRQQNVADAFAPAWWYSKNIEKYVRGKNILLVDDLCTTGSTLVSAAKVLYKAQPASITAVVAARAI
ncbi:MAG: ComF family protein [Epsilonproteobacteria bacterium]|nr:ComF family protein [Campylobacterota bacterium]